MPGERQEKEASVQRKRVERPEEERRAIKKKKRKRVEEASVKRDKRQEA